MPADPTGLRQEGIPVTFHSNSTLFEPPGDLAEIGDVWTGPGFRLVRTADGWVPADQGGSLYPDPVPAPTRTPLVAVTPGDVIDRRAERRAAVGTVARHALILLATLAVGLACGVALAGVLS